MIRKLIMILGVIALPLAAGTAPASAAPAPDPTCTLTEDAQGYIYDSLAGLTPDAGTNKYYEPVLTAPDGSQHFYLIQTSTTTYTATFANWAGAGVYTGSLYYVIHRGPGGNDSYDTTLLSTACQITAF